MSTVCDSVDTVGKWKRVVDGPNVDPCDVSYDGVTALMEDDTDVSKVLAELAKDELGELPNVDWNVFIDDGVELGKCELGDAVSLMVSSLLIVANVE